MKESIYLETSVISYYTSRPSRDLVVAGHQQITRDFINNESSKFDIFISQIVLNECNEGDAFAAKNRIALIKSFRVLELKNEALYLAQQIIKYKIIPNRFSEDALHISIATIHGIEYLVTWNCKHIANALMRHKFEEVIQDNGYKIPIICTPEELVG